MQQEGWSGVLFLGRLRTNLRLILLPVAFVYHAVSSSDLVVEIDASSARTVRDMCAAIFYETKYSMKKKERSSLPSLEVSVG